MKEISIWSPGGSYTGNEPCMDGELPTWAHDTLNENRTFHLRRGRSASPWPSMCQKDESLCRCGPAEDSCEFKRDTKRNQSLDHHRVLPCLIRRETMNLVSEHFCEEELDLIQS